jgi:hypothetical protein
MRSRNTSSNMYSNSHSMMQISSSNKHQASLASGDHQVWGCSLRLAATWRQGSGSPTVCG